jgi:uncharacterized protein YcaQ
LIVPEGEYRRAGQDLRVAEVVGEVLHCIGSEVVLSPHDMVVRGAARALRIISVCYHLIQYKMTGKRCKQVSS